MTSRAIVRLSLLSHLTLFIAAVLCCTDRTLASGRFALAVVDADLIVVDHAARFPRERYGRMDVGVLRHVTRFEADDQ